MNRRVIVALDVPSRDQALELVDRVGPSCVFYKVGLELFTAAGPAITQALRDRDKRVFLDLKLHDIPNTAARATARAAESGASFLTVHAMGGAKMLAASAAAAQGMTLLAVTVLTSLDAAALGRVVGRPVECVADHVRALTEMARDAGAGGVVCSAAEAASARRILGPGRKVVTPGIRFAGAAAHDQSRTSTPGAAFRAGATHIVVGRSVTASPDPAAAFARVVAEAARPDSVPRHAGASGQSGPAASAGPAAQSG